MRRILLLSLGLLISHGALADSSLWTDLGESQNGFAARGVSDSVRYNSSRHLSLNESGILNALEGAPTEPVVGFSSRPDSPVVISLPLPDGSFAEVQAYNSPVMETGLAAELPSVKTWRVFGTDGKVLSGRIGHTSQGFHATLTMNSGDAVYIDAEEIDQDRLYHSISHTDNVDSAGVFNCGVEGHDHSDAQNILSGMAARVAQTAGNKVREYRLAVATTPDFASVAGGTTESVASSIAVVVNRLNEIYQRDVGIKFKLVDNNNDLIFGASDVSRTPSQAYTVSNNTQMLAQNQTNVDAVIGNANYDVGQVFNHTSPTSASGLASAGVVCDDTFKAQGVSGFLRYLDGFASNMVAHELAHQFSASHSFNGIVGNCSQRAASTSYEPGGGTTIMSYAGVCGTDDIQSNGDAFFHGGSIKQIVEFSTTGIGNSCGTLLDVANNAPVANAGPDFTIPKNTPFVLDGSDSSDVDGDTLTYSWEQFNASTTGTALSVGDNGTNAIIRSRPPTTETNRFIPSRLAVASGSLDKGEFLPTQARSGSDALKMILTVRDQKSGADVDEMTITVSDDGPFKITSHTAASTIAAGSSNTVTWDPAGTEVSCPAVSVLLVTGDPTYGDAVTTTSLAESQVNNGTATVTIPAETSPTSRARFGVACENNIFYALSEVNLGITSAADATNVDSVFTASDVQQKEGTLGLSHIKIRVDITPAQGTDKILAYRFVHGSTATDLSDFAFSAFTANNPNPFTTGGGAVIPFIPVGATYYDIYVPIATDSSQEGDKTFTVELVRYNNEPFEPDSTAPVNTATITILDDDIEPVTASVTAGAVTEGDDGTFVNAPFTITLDQAQTIPVTLDYSTSNGTAIAGSDYTPTSDTLTIPANTTTMQINVPVIGDTVFEGDETFSLTLSNPSIGVKFAGDASTIFAESTISENEAQPTLSISDATVFEGNSGTSEMIFTVTLSGASQSDVSVSYIATGGTATSGEDYVAVPATTLTIDAGQLSNTFTVTVQGDTDPENDETFNVTLSSATGADIDDSVGVGTIQNDEILPVQATIEDVSVTELDTGPVTAAFEVKLSAPQTIDVSVNYAIVDVSTTSGSDYTVNSGTLEFAAGTTSMPISVVVLGDEIFEGVETYNVTLSNPSVGLEFASAATSISALGTIVDNESVPTLSIDDQSVVEGNAGDAPIMTFNVSLSGPAQSDVTVQYTTSDGTGVAGTDYTAPTATELVINGGNTSGTLAVSAIGNTIADGNRTFNVNITSATPTFATVLDGVGVGTIQDDEIITASIEAATIAEGNAGDTNTLDFVVTLSANATGPMSVNYDTTDGAATGTAAESSDYTPVSGGLINFAAGERTKTISIAVTADTTPEDNETMTVTLSGATPADDLAISSSAGSAVGTITNDDPHQSVNASISSPGAISEGASGTTTSATFTVTLDAASTQTVSIDYAVVAGQTEAADITGTGGTLTFNAGEVTKDVVVEIIGDADFEADESFSVELSNPQGTATSPGAVIVTSTGNATITNDDNNRVSIAGGTFSEADGTVQLNLTLDGAHVGATPLTVAVSTTDVSTDSGDYTPLVNEVVSFEAGESSSTIDIILTDDAANEVEEEFTVSLSNESAGLSINAGVATVTLTDNDTSIVSIGSVSLPEGDALTTPAAFTVTVTPVSAVPITVNFATADGTAEEGSDYTGVASGSIIIPALTATGTVSIDVTGDGTFEADEDFTVTLTGLVSDEPAELHPTDVTGTATITNDDDNRVSIADAIFSEGDGTVQLTLTLEGVHAGATPLTVNATTADVSTSAGDYTPIAGQTVTFGTGQTTQTIDVVLIDDTANEVNETFTVNLSGESAGLSIDNGSATVTITDNDTSTVSVDPGSIAVTVVEGDTGTSTATFTINVSPSSAAAITVNYTTADGTAEAGSDYTAATSGSVEIPANATQGSITVDVTGDSLVELDETFTVTLTSVDSLQPAQLASTDLTGTATITNDDKSEVSVGDATATEGADLVFAVSLDQASATVLTVDYATSDNGATTVDSDYTAVTGTLTFAVGETSKSVTVNTTDDIVTESNEALTLTLSNPSAELTIADATATGTINNDDTNSDTDALSDAQEEIAGTDPLVADTDGDGTNDDVEVYFGGGTLTAPSDQDSDGIIDALEPVNVSPNAFALSADQVDNIPGVVAGNYEMVADNGATVKACGDGIGVTNENIGVVVEDVDYDFPNGVFHVCVTPPAAGSTQLELTYPVDVSSNSIIRILVRNGGVSTWKTLEGGVIAGSKITIDINSSGVAARGAVSDVNLQPVANNGNEFEVIIAPAKRSIVTGNATSGGGSVSLFSLMFLSMFALLCVVRRRRLAIEL